VSALTQTQAPDFTPWAQTREESEHDYAHFRLWLDLAPRPPPLDPALAIRHNWSERAAAFDTWQQLDGLSPRDIARNIFRMWSTTVMNETRKWHSKSLRQRDEPCLMPHNISEFIDLVTDPARNQASKETHDLSGLEPEEVEQLVSLLEKAAKRAKERDGQ
jgi:hypothetical protein